MNRFSQFLRNEEHFLKPLCQLIALHIYLYYLLYEFYAGRFLEDYFLVMSFAIFFDFILKWLILKRIQVPMSGMITAVAIFILMNTHLMIEPYLLAVAVGLGGKYLLRYQGKHLFNPACLGLTFTVFLFPQFAQALIKQWTAGPLHFVIVYSIGFFVAFLVKKLWLSLSYFGALFILSYLYGSLFTKLSIINITGPVFGFSVAVFAFHMLTDPKTSPQSRKEQILFGISVAGLDFLFRRLEQPYAPFMALLLISSLWRPFFEGKIRSLSTSSP